MCSKLFTFVWFFFFMIPGYSKANPSDSLERGIKANESLINFMLSHQCQVGIIESCNRKPLTPSELVFLKKSFREISDWKEDIVNHDIPENDWIQGRKFVLKKGETYSLSFKTVVNPITMKKEEVLHLVLATDARSYEVYERALTAASLQLAMYDHFLRLAQLFSKASHLGTILSTDLPEESKLFEKTFSTALNESHWKKVEKLVTFLSEAKKMLPGPANRFETYLSSSFCAKRILEKDLVFYVKTFVLFRKILAQNSFFVAFNRLGGQLSKIFGNSIGRVQVRNGKLKALAADPDVMASFKKKLRPLDILFERTPFRLTDVFIPGHYGHIAVWLGNPEELMEMTVEYQGTRISLLDHPVVRPHLEKLSQGKLVLEALREPGVTMNTLEHFMDVDDFLVTRPLQVSDPGEFLVRAFKQVGKPYDFNFDVETEKSIVCSELIYRIYDDVTWPTTLDLGRYTISPDHVAWKTVDSCYGIQLMYHDGKEIRQGPEEKLLELLSNGGIRYNRSGNCY